MSTSLRPVKLGDIAGIPDSVRLYGLGHCASTSDMPVYAFVVERSGGGVVLFDTGCAPPPRAASHGHAEVRADGYRTAAEGVAAAGIDPTAVTTVVLSHLHWDHSYGLAAFPNAEILVQRRELQGAFAPYPEHQAMYESFELGHRPHWLDSLDRVRPLDGWTDLGDGVQVVPLPGHTDGSQGLVVATRAGPTFCCCGDLMGVYESWTGMARAGGRPTGVIPNGVHTDLVALRASIETIARSGWVPLLAHDERVELVAAGRWHPRYADPTSLSEVAAVPPDHGGVAGGPAGA